MLQSFLERSPIFSVWPFRLLRRHGIRQFMRFGIVGLANTAVDFGIFTFLTRVVKPFNTHYLVANVISFSIAVTNSYFLNKYWTFRDKGRLSLTQFPKFLLSNVVALGFNEFVLFALVSYAGLYDLLAKAFAIGVSLFWNFFVNKYWVFRQKQL